MTKRGILVLIVAVLAVGGAAAAIANSIGGSDDETAIHVMPAGQTMEGESMEGGSTGEMPSTQHDMPNGETMEGSGDSGMGSGSMDGMDMGE